MPLDGDARRRPCPETGRAPSPCPVRLATPVDAAAVAGTLAAAFLDYEWSRGAVPEDDRLGRLRRLHLLYAGLGGTAGGRDLREAPPPAP